jgi:hypothetical protein
MPLCFVCAVDRVAALAVVASASEVVVALAVVSVLNSNSDCNSSRSGSSSGDDGCSNDLDSVVVQRILSDCCGALYQ